MKYLLLVTCSLLPVWLPAQADDYGQQQRVVEAMLAEKNYRSARAQATALVESGVAAQLTEVEGRGRFLLGRILTENPAATPQERVAGIRELRLAATELRRVRAASAVDSILTLLEKLTGNTSTKTEELPSVKA
ncbi:MAG: hypothetical protein AAFZ52_18215, partial [Bacteroidota bacterium]